MPIYTDLKTGNRIKSTKNPDGTTTKTILSTGTTKQNSAPSNIETPSSQTATQQLSETLAQPIESPTPINQIQPAVTSGLPEPTAPAINESNINSIAGDVVKARATIDNKLKNDAVVVDAEIERLKKEQEQILAKGEQLSQPFREKLENKERERLHINKNFEANQKLVDELDSLLTEGNELINISKGRAVANTVLSKSVNKTISDVNARAGVIQAVMSARSGQIAEAERMIDRSINAITADKNDQISYYNTLLSLNNQGLLSLDAESKGIAEEQKALAYGDLKKAEATAAYVKELMISPDSAQFMADAGVTLLDSVEQVEAKIAKQSKREEYKNVTNELRQEGYDVSSTKTPGALEIDAGGEKIYATVRPGSPLALKIEQQELAIQGQRQSIAASRTAQLLSLAKAGDAKSIKTLGFDPREIPEGGEKLDATTKRQVSDSVSAGESLLSMATQYKNLIDKHGYTNSVFGNQQVIGQIKSLRAQMTAKYKDYATLGTLDLGVTTLVNEILGEEPVSTFGGTFLPGGAPGIFTNATGRKADRLSAQLDTFITDIQSQNAKGMARLGIDTSVDLTLVPDDDINFINQAVGGTTTSTPAVSSYFE